MIVKHLNNIIGSEFDIEWGNGKSRRFLLKNDKMNFSFVVTSVNANTESYLQYNNHLEACYCIDGHGEIECEGEIFPINEGTMYALDKNDAHILRALTNMQLISIFSPALEGNEKHSLKDGIYSTY
jgi:L-ectoine synthase